MPKQPLSQAQVFGLLRKVGIDDKNARILTPIAKRESGGRYWINNAGLNQNGTVDHGLFQINDIWANDPDIKKIGWDKRYDPVANAQMAKVVLRKQGLKAWATYTSADDQYIGKGAQGYQGKGKPASGPANAPTAPSGAPRQQALLAYLQNRGKPDALLNLASGLKQAEAQAQPEPYAPSGGGKRGGGVSPATGGNPDIVNIAKVAQNKFGLTVRELEPFDKVDPVHTEGSFHYRGMAADISGDPQKMAAFSQYAARKWGPKLRELFYNGPGGVNIDEGRKVGKGFVSGHTNHVHIAARGR